MLVKSVFQEAARLRPKQSATLQKDFETYCMCRQILEGESPLFEWMVERYKRLLRSVVYLEKHPLYEKKTAAFKAITTPPAKTKIDLQEVDKRDFYTRLLAHVEGEKINFELDDLW